MQFQRKPDEPPSPPIEQTTTWAFCWGMVAGFLLAILMAAMCRLSEPR